MTEESNNDNRNDHPTEEQQPSDDSKAEYREISKEDLKQILEDHKKWLESDRKEGKKADLSRANLKKVDLRGANLQKVNLREADLRATYLKEAKLQEADFYKANLQETNLYNSDMKNISLHSIKNLSEAKLQYANLEGATGLLGNEFAQADLTGTKLPEKIEEFKALETVKETSQNARKFFFVMLLGCVYTWLTIATTTDVRLLTNTASSPLPIIPIAWFYWAGGT